MYLSSYDVVHCNLSPRGDGNALYVSVNSITLYCNLSPRGDGNICHLPLWQGMRLQFIPARGRKRRKPSRRIWREALQFIPARGRKLRSVLFLMTYGLLQFIPARGRKPELSRVKCPPQIAIYPREGTETSREKRRFSGEMIAIYPREGTET